MERLPREIQENIFTWTSRSDRKRLRLVAKTLAETLKPLVFDCVRFSAGENRVDYEKLHSSLLQWSRHPVSSYARALRLEKPTPAALSPHSGNTSSVVSTPYDDHLARILGQIQTFEYGSAYLHWQGFPSVFPDPPGPFWDIARHLSRSLESIKLHDVHMGALTAHGRPFGPFVGLQETQFHNVGSDNGEDMDQFFDAHSTSLKRVAFYGCRLSSHTWRRACQALRDAGILEYAVWYCNHLSAPWLGTSDAQAALMYELFGAGLAGRPANAAESQFVHAIEWRRKG